MVIYMTIETVLRSNLSERIIQACQKGSAIKILTPLYDECMFAIDGTDIRVWSEEQRKFFSISQWIEKMFILRGGDMYSLLDIDEQMTLGRWHWRECSKSFHKYPQAKCPYCGQAIWKTKQDFFEARIQKSAERYEDTIGKVFIHDRCISAYPIPTLGEDSYNRIPDTEGA